MFNRKKEAQFINSIDSDCTQVCCLPETQLDQGNLSQFQHPHLQREELGCEDLKNVFQV